MVEMALSNEAEMEAVLDPGQIARLRQIALQCQGPLAFRDPQVVAALKLTADQRKQIRSLEGQLFFDKRDFDKKGKGPKGPPPKGEPKKGGEKGQKGESWKGPMGEAFNARRKDVMTQIAAVLTPEQATQWSDMIGRPFESKMPIFMPGAMFSAFGPPPPEGFGPPRKKDFKDRK
jgi:hypothetical protein